MPARDSLAMSDFIPYPVDQVLAVFDTSEAAQNASEAIRRAGVGDDDIREFHGERDARKFDSSGEEHGLAEKALRGIQFTLTDEQQMLAWYEAALREGRAVLAVRATDREATLFAVEAFQRAGGHFINSFGKLASEEFAPWLGPEPAVPSAMKQ